MLLVNLSELVFILKLGISLHLWMPLVKTLKFYQIKKKEKDEKIFCYTRYIRKCQAIRIRMKDKSLVEKNSDKRPKIIGFTERLK